MLQVKSLSVDISGSDGRPIRVVDDVSFELAQGDDARRRRRIRLGQDHAGTRDHRPAARRGARRRRNHARRANLLTLSEREMCTVRGRRIGMIFQEPMTALNPAQRVGTQIAEGLIVHGG